MATVIVNGGNRLGGYLRRLSRIKTTAKVGFFAGTTYDDGTPVAYVAYLNEYGGHNPPRPFLRRTAERQMEKWREGIRSNIQGFRRFDKAAVHRAFDKAGQVARGDVKRTIADWPDDDPRPNKPATIAAKARRARKTGPNTVPIDPNRVLIDTGTMIKSVQYRVDDK